MTTLFPLTIFLLLCFAVWAMRVTWLYFDALDNLNEACHMLQKQRDAILYPVERRIKGKEVDSFIARVQKKC